MSVSQQPVAPLVADATTEQPTPTRPLDGVSLTELIQRARNVEGPEQVWLATLINRALKALPAARDKERQAALLLEMLDDEALHGLADEQQIRCRAVAVDTLMAIGYPWALQLEPDDVQFMREHPIVRRARFPVGRVATGFAGLGAASVLGVAFSSHWWRTELLGNVPELALAAGLGLVALTSVSAVTAGQPRWRRWVLGLAAAAVAGMIALDAATTSFTGVHLALLAPGVLGLVGALTQRK